MSFASVEDVAARLGVDASALNTTQVQAVLDDTSALVTAYTGIDWETLALDVPAAVRAVVVSRTVRFLNNPQGIRQETIGNYNYTLATDAGLAAGGWTEEERAVLDTYGRLLASRTGGSFFTGYRG